MQQSYVEQPYRVYLAGASTPDQIERVIAWSDRLTGAGLHVVSTWTAAGASNPRDAEVEQRRHWSATDLAELGRANALWLFCPPPGVATRGAWVELGCAYARAQLIVSSGDTRQSIFTALGVECDTDEAAFDRLRVVAAKGRP